ncbi:MAG: hypothetical protein MJZ93_04335 [Paludibacteraceae bacterium]|nr:hypothetical protein [Paludibacteraceae bacterium]
MKKVVFISLVLFLSCAKSLGYVPMLETGKTWTYFKSGVYGDPRKYMTMSYNIICDTIINDIHYFKSDFFNNNFKYNFLLREDTIAQKVYFYHTGLEREYLLYDFNVNTGDTLDVFADYGSSVYSEIMDSADYCKVYIVGVEYIIDSMGNRIKKVNYKIQYEELQDGSKRYYEDSYLEGYGSMKFTLPFYNSFKTWIPNPSSATLRCVTDSTDKLLYKNNNSLLNKYLGDACNGSGIYYEGGPVEKMLAVGRSWTYCSYVRDGAVYNYHTYTQSIIKDSIINGIKYFVLDTPICLMREDTAAGRVYIRNSDGQEYLLYDFRLKQGNNVYVVAMDSGFEGEWKTCYMIITSVGEIYDLDGRKLNVWYYVAMDNEGYGFKSGKYIERYGSTENLMMFASDLGDGGATDYLRCATDENGNLTFRGNGIMDMFLDGSCEGSGVAPASSDAIGNIIERNPVIAYKDGQLLIYNKEEVGRIDVYSASGVHVWTGKGNVNSAKLIPGIYFALIFGIDGREIGKGKFVAI